MSQRLTLMTIGVCMIVLMVGTSLWSATATESATTNQSVTYMGLVFAVPRTWRVVPASGVCTGNRPTVVVGSYTGFAPVQCTAFANQPQPTIEVSSMGPPPVNILFNQQRTTSTGMIHGVRYTLTYGRGNFGVGLNSKPLPSSWGFIAGFLGSPVYFQAIGAGPRGSSGFKAAMKILTSVRRS